MKRVLLLLCVLWGLPVACQQAGGPASSLSGVSLSGDASSFDGAAAADGSRGGVVSSNPSPEEFRPDAGFKKKDDGENEAGDAAGESETPLAYAKMAPMPKAECGGTLLRCLAWKEDIRVAAGQSGKSPEEFFKFLQAGGLDPALASEAFFRDVCAKDDSPQTLSEIEYPPVGLHVLFKAPDAAMAGLWAKPVTSAEHLKSLVAEGQLIAVGVSEDVPAPEADAPIAPIKIPGKK